MGFCPGSGRAFDLGLKLGEMASENPRLCRRRARQPRPLHLGTERPRSATRRRLRIINKAADWLEAQRAASRPSAAQRSTALDEAERRAAAAAADAGDPRPHLASDECKIGHFTDAPEVLEFVNSQALDSTGAARHLLPRSLPAHQDQAARSFPSDVRCARGLDATASRPIAPTTRPITSAASIRIRPGCAIPTR